MYDGVDVFQFLDYAAYYPVGSLRVAVDCDELVGSLGRHVFCSRSEGLLLGTNLMLQAMEEHSSKCLRV